MRNRLTAKQLMREAEKIACFRAMYIGVTENPHDRVYVRTLFDAYKSFLHDKDLEKTPLSIDGFGKMLHLKTERKVMKIGNSPLARGFVGVRLIGKMPQ